MACKPQARTKLAHLIVLAADVDGPADAGAHAHDLFLPAQPFDPFLDERFPARKVDGHFEESGVNQLHPALLGPLLDLLNARRLEIHNGDQVVAFGEHKLVSGIVTHAVQMIQIAIGAVNAFIGEVGQPPATRRMKVGHDETFQGCGFRGWFGAAAGEKRNAARRGAGHACQKASPIHRIAARDLP